MNGDLAIKRWYRGLNGLRRMHETLLKEKYEKISVKHVAYVMLVLICVWCLDMTEINRKNRLTADDVMAY